MTWYILTILWIACSSLQRIIEKKIVIWKEFSLDPLIGSFYRNLAFYIFLIIFWLSVDYFWKMYFFISFPIIFRSFFHVFKSIIYDYFLKNTELSRYNSLTFIFPIILVLIDNFFLWESYTFYEIIWIWLLIFWWWIITIERKTKKNIFSFKQWFLLLIWFLIWWAQFILFKYYNETIWLNEISFYTSSWIFVLLFFIIQIIYKKKFNILISTAKHDWFFLKTLSWKFLDSLWWLLILKAISISTVSKVYSLESIYPIFTFLLVIFLMKVVKINMKEDLDTKNIWYKIISILLISIWWYLLVWV